MDSQKQRLTDVVPFTYKVTEDKGPGGLMVVQGIFQRANIQNENRRRYPRNVLDKALKDPTFQEALTGGSLFGELDHPDDGETKLHRTAHLIRDLRMTEDGAVIGRTTIMNTGRGRDLQEIFRAGGRVGISSRGSGSLSRGEDGVDDVQEDFVLDTFDFVAAPSTPGAYPRVMESKKRGSDMPDSTTEFRSLRERATKLLAQKPSLMTEAARRQFRTESETVEISLNRLADQDHGLKSLCQESIDKLSKKRRTLESAAAPPSVEKMVAASEAVIGELVNQLGKQRKGLLEAARRKISSYAKRARLAVAEASRAKRHLAASYAVGEELAERFNKAEVRAHVTKVLADPKNARLLPMREALGRCSSVKEVNKFVKRIRESKPARRRAPKRRGPALREQIRRQSPRSLARPDSAPTLRESAVEEMARQGDRLRLGKRLKLQY